MKLWKLRLDDFMQAMVNVNQRLNDTAGCSVLLDAAREDTPIVGELLEQIALLHGMPGHPRKKLGIMTAQRDLAVILAFRHLEQSICAAGS